MNGGYPCCVNLYGGQSQGQTHGMSGIRHTGKAVPTGFHYSLQSYVRVSLLLLAQAVSSSWNSFSPLFAPIKIQEEETSSGGMLFLPN